MKTITLVVLIALVSAPLVHAEQDSVFSTISGDSVIIWDMNVRENCTSRFRISIDTSIVHQITLTETDTIGPLANCLCTYDLSAAIVGLDTGHYTVDVNRHYSVLYHYDTDTAVHIGTASFDVTYLPVESFSELYHQSVCHISVGVNEREKLPSRFYLSANYPNPFNPSTIVSYGVPVGTDMRLSIMNVLGEVVAVLAEGKKTAGNHTVTWDASRMPNGVYFCRMQAGEFSAVKKLILIK